MDYIIRRFISHIVALSFMFMFANVQCLILRETFVDKNSIQLKHKPTCSVAYILLVQGYVCRQSKKSLHNTLNKTMIGVPLLILVAVQMKQTKKQGETRLYSASQRRVKRCRRYFLVVAHKLIVNDTRTYKHIRVYFLIINFVYLLWAKNQIYFM